MSPFRTKDQRTWQSRLWWTIKDWTAALLLGAVILLCAYGIGK